MNYNENLLYKIVVQVFSCGFEFLLALIIENILSKGTIFFHEHQYSNTIKYKENLSQNLELFADWLEIRYNQF